MKKLDSKIPSVIPLQNLFILDYNFFLALSTDLQQRKMATDDHYDVELEKYLDLVEFIILVLDREGKVLLANRRAQEVLGYDEGKLIGLNWFENFVPDEVEELSTSVMIILNNGHP
ncbi:MAG: PAS domain-containing protein [Candidatus Bipolaricaulota bacterium]